MKIIASQQDNVIEITEYITGSTKYNHDMTCPKIYDLPREAQKFYKQFCFHASTLLLLR